MKELIVCRHALKLGNAMEPSTSMPSTMAATMPAMNFLNPSQNPSKCKKKCGGQVLIKIVEAGPITKIHYNHMKKQQTGHLTVNLSDFWMFGLSTKKI